MAVLLSFVAAALIVLAAIGARMMRTTGLEDVAAAIRTAREDSTSARGLVPLLDLLGARLVGTALRLYGPTRLTRLEETIRRAGRPDGITVTSYVRRQMGFVVISSALVVVFAMLGEIAFGLVLAAVLCSWMTVWLVGTGRRRQAQIEAELPDFLDVLGVTVTAGLGFRQAVERVCEFHDSALAQEMTTTLHEMAVGVSRRQAFISMRERTRSEPVGTFVTALLQAEELGVPLANALNDIAADVRKDRAQRVRQAAAKAAPKMSLVVTVTIVPGALILVGSALVLANLGSLRGLL